MQTCLHLQNRLKNCRIDEEIRSKAANAIEGLHSLQQQWANGGNECTLARSSAARCRIELLRNASMHQFEGLVECQSFEF